jgi:hypothetical protein
MRMFFGFCVIRPAFSPSLSGGVTVLLLLHTKMPAKRIVRSDTASYAARSRMLLDYRISSVGSMARGRSGSFALSTIRRFDPFRPAGEGMVGLIAHAT